jgi:hypothetical protein
MRSTPVHVAFAALAMGGWALLANRGHPPADALRAAGAQGVLSGVITLILKRALEAMAARLSGRAARLFPPCITAVVILGVLVLVHRLIGTPEILRTIAVPWSVSTVYAFAYTALIACKKGSPP